MQPLIRGDALTDPGILRQCQRASPARLILAEGHVNVKLEEE
jgi:hypothetical protein